MGEDKRPHRVYRAGGRSFPVYLEEDGKTGERHPVYPNFEERPEYTAEGRPFATAAQEACPHRRPKIAGGSPPGDCGGCGWFYRENTPYDLIGVCMCDARRKPKSKKEEIL
jgi:hypothetical protein